MSCQLKSPPSCQPTPLPQLTPLAVQSTPQSGKVTWNEVIAFVNPNAALQLLDASSLTRRVSSKN